jgi:hypothetical protein
MWASSFDLINKKDIKENNMDFREVSADLRRQWITLQPKASSIAKGAFPSYGPATEQDRLETVESEDDKPRQKKTANKKGKRKRTETDTTGAASVGGGSCGACLGPHTLKNCYYAFEEEGPEGWTRNLGIKRLVEHRIKADNSLAEQIKRLRKGKDICADDS